jgi:hypothetical protein
MSDQFTIKPATRQGVKPLVGFYGKSGSGKTMSALLLARGLVGPAGRVVLVDSESGRGSIFSDLIPGGYSVLDLDAPFSPMRYEGAIAEAEKVADCVVVDSMSHEWSGEWGVLDWADQELEKMGGGDNNKMRSWIKPKMAHKQMVMRLLRCKCALICCLRGEEKTHVGKAASGKTTVVTDDFSTPLFDPRFIFELLLNFETLVGANGQGGYVIPRKITHPSIAPLLPQEGQQIGVATGEALAKWCASPGGAPASTVASRPIDDLATVKRALWDLTKPKHGGDKAKFVQWLVDECLIDPSDKLEELTAANYAAVLKAAQKKLQEPGIVP